MRRVYITTPIYYPSGNPHIGHAYTTILGDVLARYKRLIGCDVFFLTGMDEHGQKIEDTAKKNNIPPQKLVDDYAIIFQDLWKLLDIDYQGFVRTSSVQHKKVVEQVFETFLENKLLYLGTWKGLYCVSCEENYTLSTATKKDDGELYCRVGHKLVHKEEESYFFKMNNFSKWVIELYEKNNNMIIPSSRVHELTNSFLKEGISDLSVSRTTLTWGVSVLSNPKHRVYVWIDALLNYLSALGYLSNDDSLFKKYWQDEKCEVIHLMSKEITRFHCIYWPIMLSCLNLRLPTKVISHGWIITEQGKMSKSFGNVIDPKSYVQEYGSDALRYFLMSEMGYEKDGIFTDELFIGVYNTDLANIYGNLVSRFIGMVHKFTNDVIPQSNKKNNSKQNELIKFSKVICGKMKKLIDTASIREILQEIKTLANAANKFIQESQPWVMFAEDKKEELNNFLSVTGNVIRIICTLIQPVLVKFTKTVSEQMNFSKTDLLWENINNFDLLDNHKVRTGAPIFARKEK